MLQNLQVNNVNGEKYVKHSLQVKDAKTNRGKVLLFLQRFFTLCWYSRVLNSQIEYSLLRK